MKKTWIKLKRGVLEGKHVRAIGPALWLFCLMADRADWETGIVSDWKDTEAAEALDINPHTARDWRQRLVHFGYIKCVQRAHTIDVQIHNWTNPREYGGEVKSPSTTRPADMASAWEPDQGDVFTSPSERVTAKGSVQGDVQGSVQDDVSPTVPSYSPQNHIPQSQDDSSLNDEYRTCPKCGGRYAACHEGKWPATDCRAHSGSVRGVMRPTTVQALVETETAHARRR